MGIKKYFYFDCSAPKSSVYLFLCKQNCQLSQSIGITEVKWLDLLRFINRISKSISIKSRAILPVSSKAILLKNKKREKTVLKGELDLN